MQLLFLAKYIVFSSILLGDFKMAVIEQIKGELFHLSHSIDENPQIADFNAHIHDSYELFCFVNGDANYSVAASVSTPVCHY